MLSKNDFIKSIAQKFIKNVAADIKIDECDFSIYIKYNGAGYKLNLDNIYNIYQKYITIDNSNQEEILNSMFKNIRQLVLEDDDPDEMTCSDFSVIRNKIYPYLKSNKQLLNKDFASDVPITETLNAYLSLTYVIDTDDKIIYINKKDIEHWGKTNKEIIEIGRNNFYRDMDIAPAKIRVKEGIEFYYFATKDSYDATRIILHKQFDFVKKNLGKEFLIGIPNRDFVIMFSKSPYLFRKKTIERVLEDYESMQYPITDVIFKYKNGLLQPYI